MADKVEPVLIGISKNQSVRIRLREFEGQVDGYLVVRIFLAPGGAVHNSR